MAVILQGFSWITRGMVRRGVLCGAGGVAFLRERAHRIKIGSKAENKSTASKNRGTLRVRVCKCLQLRMRVRVARATRAPLHRGFG